MFKAGSIVSDLGLDARPMSAAFERAGKAAQTFADTMDKQVSAAVEQVEQQAKAATKQLQAMSTAGAAAVRAATGGGAVPVARITAVGTAQVAHAIQPVVEQLDAARGASNRFSGEHARGMLQAQAVTRAFGPTIATFIADPLLGVIDLGNRATVSIGRFVAGMIGRGVRMAAEFEQTKVAMTTMIGSAEGAKKLLKGLSGFAEKTPFNLTELQQVSRQLMAMGFGADEVLGQLRLVGDVAAGTGKPIGQIAYAYGQVRTAGRLMGTELMQFLNAGVPMIDELAKVLGVPKEEVKKLVETGRVGFADVQAAFEAMTGSGGRFNDMMAKQAGTAAGAYSNLIDAIDRTMMAFGLAFAESAGLAKGTNSATNAISGLVETGRVLGEVLGSVVNPVLHFVASNATLVAGSIAAVTAALAAGGLIATARLGYVTLKALAGGHREAAAAAAQNAAAQNNAANAMNRAAVAAQRASIATRLGGALAIGAAGYGVGGRANGTAFNRTVDFAGTGAMFGMLGGPKGALIGGLIGGVVGALADAWRAVQPRQLQPAANAAGEVASKLGDDLKPAMDGAGRSTSELASSMRSVASDADSLATAIAGMARGDSGVTRSAATAVNIAAVNVDVDLTADEIVREAIERVREPLRRALQREIAGLDNEMDRRNVQEAI